MKYLDFIKQEMAVIMDRDPAIKTKMEVFLYPSFWALLSIEKLINYMRKVIIYRAGDYHKRLQERRYRDSSRCYNR